MDLLKFGLRKYDVKKEEIILLPKGRYISAKPVHPCITLIFAFNS